MPRMAIGDRHECGDPDPERTAAVSRCRCLLDQNVVALRHDAEPSCRKGPEGSNFRKYL